MLSYYRVDNILAVGAPWWRFLVRRSPVGILLRTGCTFPPTHPTTKMCLRLMVQALNEKRCQRLVDVGCGSGILALAGLKLGVKWAVALDPSLRAISTSRANAELNQVARRLSLVRGSTEAVTGPFDLVLANLPMPVLVDKLPELVRLGAGGAALVLSGFQDLDKSLLDGEIRQQQYIPQHWLSGDLSFYGVPPSGSFTWMAVLASAGQQK